MTLRFDGLTETGEPVELKVPGQKTWDDVARHGQESRAYGLYWVQVQFQCYVAEAERGWLVFDPVRSGVNPLEFEILRDPDFIAQVLVPSCLRFAEAVRTGQAPAPDPARDRYAPQGESQVEWQRQAQAYRTAEAEARRLETALKAVKARQSDAQSALVTLMGDYLLADQDGVQVLRYRQRGSVDYPAVLDAIAPDLDPQILEAHRRPSTTRVKVTLQGETEEGGATEGAQQATSGENPGPTQPKRRRRPAVAPASATRDATASDAQEGEVVVGYF